MKLPDYPVANTPVRASWGRQIVDYLRSITPQPSPEIYPTSSANGTTFKLKKRSSSITQESVSSYKKPFDLEDITADSFSIANNMATAGGVWVDYVKIGTISVSGINADWTSGTISAAQYVYLERDHEAETTTLVMATSLPDGSMAEGSLNEVFPLWYIAWDTENEKIDSEEIVDLRGALRTMTLRKHDLCVSGNPFEVMIPSGEPF